MLFPLAIGVIAWLIGFDRFFVAFHEVLFSGIDSFVSKGLIK